MMIMTLLMNRLEVKVRDKFKKNERKQVKKETK